MRIWSLHPKYIDSKGVVALWREALLAKKVLEGNTKGYINHPQLERFRKSGFALDAINLYLISVYENSLDRGYHFSRDKINWDYKAISMTVTEKQLNFEKNHLLMKLKKRDHEKFLSLSRLMNIEPHPMFQVIKGEIEDWEKNETRT